MIDSPVNAKETLRHENGSTSRFKSCLRLCKAWGIVLCFVFRPNIPPTVLEVLLKVVPLGCRHRWLAWP